MKQNRIFHKHPVLSLIVVQLVMLLVIDVTGTNIYKYYAKSKIEKYDNGKEYRIQSDYYHHDIRPNVNFPKTAWGNIIFPMATNSLGFKDKEPRQISLSSEHHRILFIGDSFTEGIGVAYENTFVGIIDDAFRKKGVEVLNAAVVSYSPTIHYAKVKYLLDRVGLKFDELVVFIDLCDNHNDGVDYRLDGDKVVDRIKETEIDDARTEKFNAAKKEKQGFYLKLETILRRDTILTHFAVRGLHDLFFPRDYSYDYDSINRRWSLWTVNQSIYNEFGRAGLDASAKSMELLAGLCREKGIVLTIAVYPWPDQIVNHDLNSLQVQFWSNWAKKHDVKIINFFPSFISEKQDLAAVRRVLDANFIHNDVHWNNEGHRKIAEVFLENFKISDKTRAK